MSPVFNLKHKGKVKKLLREDHAGHLSISPEFPLTAEKMYRDLVELAHEGITMVDENEVFTFVNEQFAKSLGYKVKDLIGRSMFSLLTNVSALKVRQETAKRRTGKRSRYEVTYLHRNGTKRFFWLSASPIYGPSRKFIGSMAVLRDMTDKKVMQIQLEKAQKNLSSFNRELRKTVEEKTHRLKEANKRLSSLNRLKDEFIAITSHELRSPLTSIRGYLSLLVEKDAISQMKKPYRDYLVRAYSTTDSLNYLINNILDVSRLNMGRFELQKRDMDLIKLIRNILDSLSFQFNEKKLKLEFQNNTGQEQVILPFDPIRFSQVLRNILDNSIKFSKRGKKITVSIERNNKQVSIILSDQGMGIPKVKLDQIFDKFMQVKTNHTKHKGGVGLGLFIAKRIVELHDGKIVASKNEAGGTTISIHLPLKNKQ